MDSDDLYWSQGLWLPAAAIMMSARQVSSFSRSLGVHLWAMVTVASPDRKQGLLFWLGSLIENTKQHFLSLSLSHFKVRCLTLQTIFGLLSRGCGICRWKQEPNRNIVTQDNGQTLKWLTAEAAVPLKTADSDPSWLTTTCSSLFQEVPHWK